MPDQGGGLARRLAWFLLFYLLGVGSVGALAVVLRLWLHKT